MILVQFDLISRKFDLYQTPAIYEWGVYDIRVVDVLYMRALMVEADCCGHKPAPAIAAISVLPHRSNLTPS